MLLRISCADDSFSDPEQEIIKTACKIFGVSDSRYLEMRSKYLKTPASEVGSMESTSTPLQGPAPLHQPAPAGQVGSAMQVLGLAVEATDEEVVERYKKLSAEYSPSRIIEFGLPHEFVELAEKKFREIQDAFKTVKAERGM